MFRLDKNTYLRTCLDGPHNQSSSKQPRCEIIWESEEKTVSNVHCEGNPQVAPMNLVAFPSNLTNMQLWTNNLRSMKMYLTG